MRYLPIHIDLLQANILIVGGGVMAESKLRTLLQTPARLFVVSEKVSENIKLWADENKLVWLKRAFSPSDVNDKRLVYVANSDRKQETLIAKLATDKGILVNIVDDKNISNFITPALVNRAPVTVSIGTEGHSPAIARLVKSEIEDLLPSSLGQVTVYLAKIRETLQIQLPQFVDRLNFWKAMMLNETLVSLCSLDKSVLNTKQNSILDAGVANKRLGKVVLVGGGSGDPGLLTRQASLALGAADVIVYDRLISSAVLELGRREAEYIYVGKTPNGQSTSQDTINSVLVKKAQEGLYVIRLKGGDPLLFGRADEEMDFLEKAGISVDIVPGISAAVASAASIGRSLTTRGVNSSLTLMSGHDANGFADHDWVCLARPNNRAIVYMGLGVSEKIQEQLLANGASPDMPITIIENASLATEKIIATSLRTVSDDIKNENIQGPAVLMLGYKPRNWKT